MTVSEQEMLFIASPHDAAPSPGDERKPTQTVCAAYRSPMPWGFIAGKVMTYIALGKVGEDILGEFNKIYEDYKVDIMGIYKQEWGRINYFWSNRTLYCKK